MLLKTLISGFVSIGYNIKDEGTWIQLKIGITLAQLLKYLRDMGSLN